MKTAYRFLLLTLLSFYLLGCQSSWDVTLYAQKIDGSSKIIYKYDAWGGRDTHKFGYAILNSATEFNVNNIVDLPISYLQDIPSEIEINAIECAIPNNNESTLTYFPIKKYNITDNDINIKIKKYQYGSMSNIRSGLGDYNFSDFSETRDSLFFYDLNDTKSIEKEHLDSLKFKKSNVVIRQSKQKKFIR